MSNQIQKLLVMTGLTSQRKSRMLNVAGEGWAAGRKEKWDLVKIGPGGPFSNGKDFSLGLDEEEGHGRDLSQSINSWTLVILTYFECYTRNALLRFAWRPTELGEYSTESC